MTLEPAPFSEESLSAVRDNSLVDNYQPHDIAQDYLETRLREAGYTVIQHGDDARHADEVFFGEGPDVAALDDGEEEPCGYFEVKSKRLATGEEWFGRLNRRHWNGYVEFADETDAPVFIYFALVDEDEDCIVRQGFVEVTGNAIDGPVAAIDGSFVAFPEEALVSVDGGRDDLVAVPVDQLVGFASEQVIDGIPAIKGNDVVCVDEKQCRSWPWLFARLS